MSSRIALKASLRRDIDLSKYTTMQVGGSADYFAEPKTEEELQELLEFAFQDNIPVMILGKGSNTIFSDDGFKGLVITLIHFDPERVQFHDGGLKIAVSAGMHLYRFSLICRDRGLGGVEFLASIPGTIGGALRMNAGFSRHPGQKNEIADIVEEVEVMDLRGKKEILHRNELQFSYRKSNLTGRIILGAAFRLWRRPTDAIEAEIRANFKYRNLEQDVRFPSSGSIFKNPVGSALTAGQMIDQAGLKGYRIGGALISPKHGNYMVNAGSAKSRDFVALIESVQKKIFDLFGVWLETEVLLI